MRVKRSGVHAGLQLQTFWSTLAPVLEYTIYDSC